MASFAKETCWRAPIELRFRLPHRGTGPEQIGAPAPCSTVDPTGFASCEKTFSPTDLARGRKRDFATTQDGRGVSLRPKHPPITASVNAPTTIAKRETPGRRCRKRGFRRASQRAVSRGVGCEALPSQRISRSDGQVFREHAASIRNRSGPSRSPSRNHKNLPFARARSYLAADACAAGFP
jgi:hypothetical protein